MQQLVFLVRTTESLSVTGGDATDMNMLTVIGSRA